MYFVKKYRLNVSLKAFFLTHSVLLLYIVFVEKEEDFKEITKEMITQEKLPFS